MRPARSQLRSASGSRACFRERDVGRAPLRRRRLAVRAALAEQRRARDGIARLRAAPAAGASSRASYRLTDRVARGTQTSPLNGSAPRTTRRRQAGDRRHPRRGELHAERQPVAVEPDGQRDRRKPRAATTACSTTGRRSRRAPPAPAPAPAARSWHRITRASRQRRRSAATRCQRAVVIARRRSRDPRRARR